MKALIKVHGINTARDINKIKKAIINNEGIIACQITQKKGEVEVIYDNYFVNEDIIIESIENIGYMVLN